MSNKQIVFLFSGHGTQYYHMGKELYENNSLFKHNIEYLDSLVQEIAGYSVIDELYHEKHRKCDSFTDIRYTHLALFMVQYSLAQCIMSEDMKPDYVIGTSLGEYVALAISEVISIEDMIRFLLMQARLLYSSRTDGGMLSVIDDINKYKDAPLLSEVEIAAINSNRNFVISGPKEELKKIEQTLHKKVLFSRLDIAYSFHSAAMDMFSTEMQKFYDTLTLRRPKVHMISCAKCEEILEIEKGYLWSIARDTIRFKDTIESHEKSGEYIYIDLSPSGTLLNYLHDILGKNRWFDCYRVMSPYVGEEIKQYKETIKALKNYGERKEKMRAIVFAGQGSQKVGMGKDLFDLFPDLVEKADNILGYSIKELCLQDPEHHLDQTEYTQPAIYVVNALNYYKMKQNGVKADYFAGHSLGEYNALQAAGVFSFEDGLKLVKQRGFLMGQSKEGGMAALIDVPNEKIRELLDNQGIDSIDFANYNSPRQIVVAGPKKDLEILEQKAGVEKLRCVMLRVSAAFHSRYMTTAQEKFAEYLETFSLAYPTINVISNYTALPYKKEELYNTLAKQINHSVRWTDSVTYMLDQGVEEFIEVGESRTLTRLIDEIKVTYVSKKVVEREVKMEQQLTNVASEKCIDKLIDQSFIDDYKVKYPYVLGGMYHGISSVSMTVRAAQAGFLAFYGTGGMKSEEIKLAIQAIKRQVSSGFGMNFTPSYSDENYNDSLINLFLQNDISVVEASGFVRMIPSMVRYRLHGLRRGMDGRVYIKNRIIAKLSRPEIAELFMKPAPNDLVNSLLAEGRITEEEAELSKQIPMADDICLEQDSGGHTDQGSAFIIFPTIQRMVRKYCEQYKYTSPIRLGLGGSLGTPEAIALAFYMGAKFVVTGSINQCTVEAGISDIAKELLAEANIKDTEYAPAGDMFEIGAKVQVLKKGVFFPARANRLYEAYKFYDSIDDFDSKLREQIEKFYFKKSIEEIYEEVKAYYSMKNPGEIERAEANKKYKMALILKQYFRYATNAAITGDISQKANFQILCGNAMGAFNQWAKETEFNDYRKRHVDQIALRLLEETEYCLQKYRY